MRTQEKTPTGGKQPRSASTHNIGIPGDFAVALAKANALEYFRSWAPSHQKEHVRVIEQAKSTATRVRRIGRAVQMILEKQVSV